jgi:hypothetical protein
MNTLVLSISRSTRFSKLQLDATFPISLQVLVMKLYCGNMLNDQKLNPHPAGVKLPARKRKCNFLSLTILEAYCKAGQSEKPEIFVSI